jgi:hypothetical protein
LIELKSVGQMARAIERARKLRPFVRVRGFRWYEVASADGTRTYTLHFYRTPEGRRLADCTCKGHEAGYVCWHVAAAAAVHTGIAAMRQVVLP